MIEKNKPVLFLNSFIISHPTHFNMKKKGKILISDFKRVVTGELRFIIEKPEISSPFLLPEYPWEEMRINSYLTVIYDNGKYRLWYETLSAEKKRWHPYGLYLCYAESEDGYKWRKPLYKNISFKNYNKTNIIFPPDKKYAHGGTVFKDSSDEKWPYKLIIMRDSGKGYTNIEGAVSKDGIKWNLLKKPLIESYHSDTQTVCYYHKSLRKYLGFFRRWHLTRRTIAFSETDDFYRWDKPEISVYLKSFNEDLYTNAYTVYPFNDNFHFLFPAVYRRNPDTFELTAYSSVDGKLWERIVDENFLKPEDVGEENGMVCAGPNLVPFENGEKVALPFGFLRHPHNYPYISLRKQGEYRWAIWEKERIGGVKCDGECSFSTILFVLKKKRCKLFINFKTHKTGIIKVQIADKDGNPVNGYTFNDSILIQGNGEEVVNWKGKKELPEMEEMSFQFLIRNGKIYSFKIK